MLNLQSIFHSDAFIIQMHFSLIYDQVKIYSYEITKSCESCGIQ